MALSNKSIIYYTDGRLEERPIAQRVRAQLETIGLPIVSCSLLPLDFGDTSIHYKAERGYLTMFQQILACLEASKSDVIFFAEHDCYYPKEHFDFTPPDNNFYYDVNWWKVRDDGLAVSWEAAQVSGLCAPRELAIKWYKKRIETFDENDFDRKFEPTIDDHYETFKSPVPYIDIRGNWNITYNKWKLAHFRKKETAVNFKSGTIADIPGWTNLATILR